MKDTIKFYWNSFLNSIAFYFAKKEADKLHKLTGKRYHVVPKSNNKLMVIDNTWIDHYNRSAKKHGGKTINIDDLLRMSYYSTSVVSLSRK